MIGLLDVGLLVALFEPAHVHHESAHGWFGDHREEGWATCAQTENGLIQALAHPNYPGGGTTVANAMKLLRGFTQSGDHHFWPGSTSLRRQSRVDTGLLEGHDQVTITYLLLMAVEHEGRLVTLEENVPTDAVLHAGPEHVVGLI